MEEMNMSKFIDRPRYACALGGALATLRAIPRAIPIIHASAGCGHNLQNAINPGAGYLGGGYAADGPAPHKVAERDIVFGGENGFPRADQKPLENVRKPLSGADRLYG
jgi:nitrogenase molybdenum-iron protein beta chain